MAKMTDVGTWYNREFSQLWFDDLVEYYVCYAIEW
jgi:hypothetical protein